MLPPKIFLCSTYIDCTRNLYDTTHLYYFFKNNRFHLVRRPSRANVIVITTCGFDRIKENRTIRMIRHYYQRYKTKSRIILCGCLASTCRTLGDMFPGTTIIAAEDSRAFNDIFKPGIPIGEIKTNCLNKKLFAQGRLHPERAAKEDYYIHICEGCVNNCSYCDYKMIHKHVTSRPAAKIISELHQGTKAGFKRIVLLADDCGSYGVDRHTDLAKLLDLLRKFRNRDFKLAINFLEPRRLVTLYPELPKGFIRDHVCEICIPLQSCSRRILKRMNRHYDVARVLEIAGEIKRLNPGIHLSTHIIYGFPGETRKELFESFRVLDVFDEAIYFCYLDKPGTRAAYLDHKVPKQEILRRTNMIKEKRRELRSSGRPGLIRMAYTDREIKALLAP